MPLKYCIQKAYRQNILSKRVRPSDFAGPMHGFLSCFYSTEWNITTMPSISCLLSAVYLCRGLDRKVRAGKERAESASA
jgi:hypothetical protein